MVCLLFSWSKFPSRMLLLVTIAITSLSWFSTNVEATSHEHYQRATGIINQLTNPDHYDNRLRPSFQDEPLNITVNAFVMTLGPISEIKMEFGADMILFQSWTDERLKNNLTHKIVIQGEKKSIIWLPDTYFENVKSAYFHKVPSDESKIEIFPDGGVMYTARIALIISCKMRLSRYPLDTQKCDLKLQSFSYAIEDVQYFWDDREIDVKDADMAEFSLEGSLKETKKLSFNNHTNQTFSALNAQFVFKRGLGYAFIQIYAPTCLIVILSWLNFWIPLEAVPARTALGITTVLTIVTLMGSIRSYVPKVSYVKAIDYYLIVSFAFVFGSILEFVCASLHDGLKKKKRMRRAVGPAPEEEAEEEEASSQSEGHSSQSSTPERSKDLEHGNESEDSDLGVNKHEILLKKQVENVGFLLKAIQTNVRSKTNTMKDAVMYAYVRNDADIIDRMSRVFFPIFYAVFNVLYWVFYLGPWELVPEQGN